MRGNRFGGAWLSRSISLAFCHVLLQFEHASHHLPGDQRACGRAAGSDMLEPKGKPTMLATLARGQADGLGGSQMLATLSSRSQGQSTLVLSRDHSHPILLIPVACRQRKLWGAEASASLWSTFCDGTNMSWLARLAGGPSHSQGSTACESIFLFSFVLMCLIFFQYTDGQSSYICLC